MSLSFGTPSSAPATSSLAGGFSFGANKPATGFGFSTPQASTGLFGTSAAATSTFGTTPAFGAPTASAFGATSTPAFGATSTPAFGATSAPGFGATSTAPAFGAGLGGMTGLSFGAGSNTTTTSTGLGFGAPISSATTGGLNFGAPASTAPGLGGFNFGGTAASGAPNLGFGLLGSAAATTSTPSLFGPKLGVASAIAQPSTSGSLGLGGAAAGAGAGGAGDTSAAGSKGAAEQQPKQSKLPNELSATIDSFHDFVKKQKSLGADVMRVSIKPLLKVSQQVEETTRAALALSGEAGRARAHSRRLRAAAARALAAAERADIPGADSEGLAPPAFVLELIGELEAQLLTFRRQMDVADRQMQAPQRLLTEQELSLGMRRMHESLVALAGRLQAVHALVQDQKQKYLNLRTHMLNDSTDIFDKTGAKSLESLLRDAESGRRKRTSLTSEAGRASAVLTDPRAALGSLQQATGPTPFTYLGSTLSSFPTADITGTSWGQPASQPSFGASLNVSGFAGVTDTAASAGFQLQKPPKRGKQ